MDAEQLAAIRARTDAASKRTDNPDDALAVDLLGITYYREDVPALLAEVERLRAENAALKEAPSKEEVDPDFWAPHPSPSTTRRVVMIARAGGEGSPSTFVDDAAESIQPSGLVDALEAENAALREHMREVVDAYYLARAPSEVASAYDPDRIRAGVALGQAVEAARTRLGKE